MNRSRLLLLSSCAVALIGGTIIACGDDDVAVRPRNDAGSGDAIANTDGDTDATSDGPTCALTLPTDYVSAAFDTNAKLELDLRTAFSAFLAPMAGNEAAIQSGDAGSVITKAQLDTLWTGNNPSVKSITTPYWQTRIDGWLKDYEEATKAGPFDLPASNSTPPSDGGTYQRFTYGPEMIDLKQAIEKGSYTAAFFNHAVGIVVGGNLTEASIDRLVAAWGANASFQNSHVANDAGTTNANRDVNSAGYAARRTPKDGTPGPYTRAKSALIKAKAAIAAGPTCNADRDAAIKEFFLEWEKATYATVVFYFSDILAKVQPTPPAHTDTVAWTNILHSHGECIGFLGGFKQTSQDYRKITDAQIDSLLTKALLPEGGASSILQLKTAPATAAISLNGALAEIKTIYGFTDAEMTSFKQVYTK